MLAPLPISSWSRSSTPCDLILSPLCFIKDQIQHLWKTAGHSSQGNRRSSSLPQLLQMQSLSLMPRFVPDHRQRPPFLSFPFCSKLHRYSPPSLPPRTPGFIPSALHSSSRHSCKHASHSREASMLTADLHLSLCSSKVNPLVSSPALPKNTCCGFYLHASPYTHFQLITQIFPSKILFSLIPIVLSYPPTSKDIPWEATGHSAEGCISANCRFSSLLWLL